MLSAVRGIWPRVKLDAARAGIATASVLAIAVYVWAAVTAALPLVTYGIFWDSGTGEIFSVRSGSPAALAGVRTGDRLVDPAPHDALRRIRAAHARMGDEIRIATAHGIVTVSPAPMRDPKRAVSTIASVLTAIPLIAFAALLCIRRPGVMAASFWLYALADVDDGILYPLLTGLPAEVALAARVVLHAVIGVSFAIPLIPFALRFPTGRLTRHARRADSLAWLSYAACVAGSGVMTYQHLSGNVGDDIYSGAGAVVAAVALVIAVALLLARFLGSDGRARAQMAWAITGFVGSALIGVAFAVFAFPVQSPDWLDWLTVPANLFPLLAIYPILRYRLIDLGFVVNRAAVYSSLTIAAVGSLAGVNWLAQRLVTERLADFLQPAAAILIGFGYFRVRAWTQRTIQRLLFRDRFAMEEHVEATIRDLAHAERPEQVDDALVRDAAATLSLASAAIFRRTDGDFVRVAANGWEHAPLDRLSADGALALELRSGVAPLQLDGTRRLPDGAPGAPGEPTHALGLVRLGTLVGIALYGRHQNGTELDPEEVQLLQRLADAASLAYDAADAALTRAELVALRREIAELRASRSAAEPA